MVLTQLIVMKLVNDDDYDYDYDYVRALSKTPYLLLYHLLDELMMTL